MLNGQPEVFSAFNGSFSENSVAFIKTSPQTIAHETLSPAFLLLSDFSIISN